MTQKYALYAAALLTSCLVPFAALADDNGFEISDNPPAQQQAATSAAQTNRIDQVTLGVQYVGGTNTNLYGRYNGFTEQGVDFLAGFTFEGRDAWDSGNTWYYNVSGINLNFQTGNRLAKGFHDSTYANSTDIDLGPTAEIDVSFGHQGEWGINASYDAISYTGNPIYSIYTVNGTDGTLNNNFLPFGGATNNPSQAGPITSFTTDTLSPAEKELQVGTRRDILQFGGQYIDGDWTIGANIRHEHKKGTLEESLRETYGGQAFTLPVDYDTDRFDVSAAYNVEDLQAIVQYTYIHFSDNNDGIVLPYPVSKSSLSSSSGPYAQSGLYSVPPSNSAHYVTLMVGHNPMPGTRIMLNGRIGVELQNDTFPANSANPDLSNTMGNPTYHWFDNLNALNQGTSKTSPEAEAWVYQGNLTVTSKLDTDLDGKLSYSFDGRNVDINQFQVWIGGGSPDATANTAVYVVPQEWFKQTANAELGYVFSHESNTRLTFGYAYNHIHRTNAQVENSSTNTESVQLISMLGSDILGRISYEHGKRTGKLIYGTAWGNLETGEPEIEGTPSGAYYQAPMTSDTVIARLNYAGTGEFTGGVFLKYADERFSYPETEDTLVGHGEGIKRDYNFTVGPDISYRPSEDVNLHAYYTYERIYFDNRGNGACSSSNTGSCLGSVGYFRNTYQSSMNTAGISGEWQASSDLKLEANYDFSSGSVIFGEFNGVMVASVSQSYQNVIPYPDISSRMHNLRLSGTYQIASNIAWSLIYQYNRFHNDDWNFLTAPVQPSTNSGTSISILTPGYPPPDYSVSTVGTVIRVDL